jgi:NADPH:quinone reductase-like Zn-dependent oxidoreductase
MRALVAAPGAPGGIESREVDEPAAAAGVVVVEVRACSLNRGECTALRTAEDGWRPGWDVAGVVAGPALDGSSPPAGTRVVAWANGGGWAERVAVRSGHLAPIPDDLSFETASTLPVAGLTALGTLAFGGSLDGSSVAITGAAGGVGRFAVQLAHDAGAKVMAVVGNPERGEGLHELGAPHSPACPRMGPSCRSGTRRTSPRPSMRAGSTVAAGPRSGGTS